MALVVGLATQEEIEKIVKAGYPLENEDPSVRPLLQDLERCANGAFIPIAVWVDGANVVDLLDLD